MPTCFVCFKEISEQEFTGAEAHKCQETSLGEPGDAIPTSDLHSNLEYKDDSDYPSSSGSPSSIARHPPRDVRRSLNLAQRSARLRQPGFEELVPGTFSSPITSLPPLDIIHRATDRRIKALESDLEQLGASSLRNLVPINPLQDLERNYRRHRRHRSAPHSRQRPLPSLPERESKQAEEESKQKAESGYGSEETLPSSSFRRHPSPPLTPWRRLLLIQDYTDHKDDLKTIINRLDDAIAATPELWISEFSEGTDGRSVPTLQFYRELHEFHQQRIANGTPSSIPYFFSRLGAKRYEW